MVVLELPTGDYESGGGGGRCGRRTGESDKEMEGGEEGGVEVVEGEEERCVVERRQADV